MPTATTPTSPTTTPTPTTATSPSGVPVPGDTVQTLEIRKEIFVAASPAVTFDAVLDQIGPGNQTIDNKPYPLTLEPWVGGRWFRDLGETGGYKYGHLWGHVQVIKAPALLELTGPMPMSYPAINHVQYRLAAEGSGTKLTFVHRAMGLLSKAHTDGMPDGWQLWMNRIKSVAESKAKSVK